MLYILIFPLSVNQNIGLTIQFYINNNNNSNTITNPNPNVANTVKAIIVSEFGKC